jgi:hypothetical protein
MEAGTKLDLASWRTRSVPEGLITCQDLFTLVTGGYDLLRSLEAVQYDIALIQGGKTLVYAVDFSELFQFLWPERAEDLTGHVVWALLNSPELKFMLPPGATVELFRHLQDFEKENQQLRQLLQSPTVQAFLKSMAPERSDSAFAELISETELEDALHQLRRVGALNNRLLHLAQMENLQSFARLLDAEDNELRPDPLVLRRCLVELNQRRPDIHQTNNYVDAYNFSFVTALSDAHVHRRQTVYLLLTSSPGPLSVFRSIRWRGFPGVLRKRLPSASLARHPIQVLYLSRVLEGSPTHQVDFDRMIEALNVLLEQYRSIDAFDEFLARRRDAHSQVQLPEGEEYASMYLDFREQYEALFAPVREAIESDVVAEENRRWATTAASSSVGRRLFGDPASPLSEASGRVFDVFDEVTDSAVALAQKFLPPGGVSKSLLDEVDSHDLWGPRRDRARLRMDLSRNPGFDCDELVAYRESSEEWYFRGDIYESYFSLLWPTRMTFPEFLGGVLRFVSEAQARREVPAGVPVPGEKVFDGIYVYTIEDPGMVRIPLSDNPRLEPDKILGAASWRKVTLVRVATDHGDLTYDFAHDLKGPQLIGITSHLEDAESVSWLMFHSMLRRAPQPDLHELIAQALSRQPLESGAR